MRYLFVCALSVLLLGCEQNSTELERYDDKFEPIVSSIEQGSASSLHSLLIWQDSRLKLELYRQGSGLNGNYQTPDVPVGSDAIHNVHSVTKSFVATLIFIAIDEGRIKSLDTPVFEFFPEYQGDDRIDKLKITVGDVLNMSTGYALDELSTPYEQGNIFTRHYTAKDLLEQFLTTHLIFEPGTRFTYSGLSTVGLSKVIEKVYGQPFTKVMKEKLFEPLAITNYQWLTQQGSSEAGADWGLRISSRDMGKFGLMWLNRGSYNGRQIVKPHWWEAVKQSRFHGYEMGYGLHFWQIPKVDSAVAAVGIGEQYIVMIPSKRAVIVATAGNYKVRARPVLALIQQASSLL